jgi:hypothetical protein
MHREGGYNDLRYAVVEVLNFMLGVIATTKRGEVDFVGALADDLGD